MRQLELVRIAKQRRIDERVSRFGQHRVQYVDAQRPEINAWAPKTNMGGPPQPIQQRPQVSYADPQINNNNGQIVDLEAEILKVMGISCDALQTMAEQFMERYKKCTTDSEKQKQLSIYWLHVNQWRP